MVFITAQDNPHPSNADEVRIAINRARDLKNNSIDFQLLPVSSSANGFDNEKFYSKLTDLSFHDLDDLSQSIQVSTTFDDLEARLMLTERKNLVQFEVPFELSKELKIGIQATKLIREAKKPSAVKLDNTSHSEVISKVFYVSGEDGERLDYKSDVKLFYEYGGERVFSFHSFSFN